MAKQKVKLMRPAKLPGNFVEGAALRPSVRIQQQYEAEWAALTDRMYREASKALREYVTTPDNTGSIPTMDAREPRLSFWQRLAELRQRFAAMFDAAAVDMASRMVAAVDRNAENTLARSLRDISKTFTVQRKETPQVLAEQLARIEENVRLIKRIPQEFMDRVVEDVQQAITNGRGIADIEDVMLQRYGEQKRWGRQVAMDQTNKAYRDINATRMREAGVRKFRWLHTSVPKHPRHFHKLSHTAGGLNGGVFDLDNPPVIDPKTGRHGLPGDDYFCHCIMQPVVEI